MELSGTYDFLLRVRRQEIVIRRKQIQRDELRACLLPGAVRYDGPKVQSSPADSMANVTARVVDLDREIEDLQKEKAAMIIKISDAIEKLADENEKTVLAEFYIARKSMEAIASGIHYSVRRTYHFRKQGVLNLAAVLPEDSSVIERQRDL